MGAGPAGGRGDPAQHLLAGRQGAREMIAA